MQIEKWGEVTDWDTVAEGEPFFVLQGDATHVAMKVLDAQGNDANAIVFTSGFKRFNTVPALASGSHFFNSSLYVIKDTVIGVDPADLHQMRDRETTAPVQAGDLLQTHATSILIISGDRGALDCIDLQSSRLTSRNFNTYALFPKWRICVRDTDRDVAIFTWPPA